MDRVRREQPAPEEEGFVPAKGQPSAHDEVLLGPPPPKKVEDDEERPEDAIPDLPENREVREFLKKAPTKGLWMPLGKEVKVMQCWRCKVRIFISLFMCFI